MPACIRPARQMLPKSSYDLFLTFLAAKEPKGHCSLETESFTGQERRQTSQSKRKTLLKTGAKP